MPSNAVGQSLIEIEIQLANELLQLDFSDPVQYVYNPIDYAIETHTKYIEKYANGSPKSVMFLGMNPGPWGMAQTGVPFGEVSIVKNWLNIRGEVKKPKYTHPKKPIEGIEGCRRTEVSGKRFWNFIKSICDTPESFSKNCIVYNHCPLIFMGKTGRNITPPDMKNIELRKNLLKHCDNALKKVIELYDVKHIVCLGRLAEARAKNVIKYNQFFHINVHFLIHPSPASPAANRGWNELAMTSLTKYGIIDLMK